MNNRFFGTRAKINSMAKAMCRGSECAVVDGGRKTDWGDIKSGVPQGYIMSGFLFLLVIDWLMERNLRKQIVGLGGG